MNLDSIWPHTAGERLVDYFRVVSTGPATPLVLALTTSRGNVNIGLTYRSAFFSAPEVEAVKGFFLDAVRQLRATT